MVKRIDFSRREFIGGCVTAATIPIWHRFTTQEPGFRTVFNAVTGEPLPGIGLVAKRVGGRGRWAFETDASGRYAFGLIPAEIKETSTIHLRLKTGRIKGEYIGFESYLSVHPQEELNTGLGDLGLIPLRPSSFPFSFPNSNGDENFRNRLVALLNDLFFAVDRKPRPRPKRTAEGALARFTGSTLEIKLADAFTTAEEQLIQQEIKTAVNKLAPGSITSTSFVKVSPEEIHTSEAELPPGSISVTRLSDFPRPAVRIRYGRTNPADIRRNPHEVLAALIIMDTFTLDELFRNGKGSTEQQQYARHMIQRCTAYALGWRPTLRLPNDTIVDENYGPPGAFTRKLITEADMAIAKAITGGGTGCYAPGIRFSTKKKYYLVADPKYPLCGMTS